MIKELVNMMFTQPNLNVQKDDLPIEGIITT